MTIIRDYQFQNTASSSEQKYSVGPHYPLPINPLLGGATVVHRGCVLCPPRHEGGQEGHLPWASEPVSGSDEGLIVYSNVSVDDFNIV